MKRYLLSLIAILVCIISNSQTVYFKEKWTSDSKQETSARLYSMDIRDDGVVIMIRIEALKKLKPLSVGHSNNTYIVSNGNKILKLAGFVDEDGTIHTNKCYGWRWSNISKGSRMIYGLFFKGTLPPSTTKISIIDEVGDCYRSRYRFLDYQISIPRGDHMSFSTEAAIKQHLDQNNDGICGIYEPVGRGARLACVKNNSEYYLIYVSSPSNYEWKNYWQVGDIKAKLRNTVSGIMPADEWLNGNKTKSTGYVTFDAASMRVKFTNGSEVLYLKSYPLETPSVGESKKQEKEWTGTGFALKNGYVVTNHHVVKDASSISVVGVNGKNVELKAEVVTVDSKNDLALIRITDYRFDGFGTIPYSINSNVADVGSDVFVLGYPLTQYMGEEIKLTNGIISSKSGYQGDITTYQISAPVQPGNSGGPMFDNDGNVIGIVNAGIPGAENVGYAIKTTYLNSLIDSAVSSSIIPNDNSLAGESLSEKVKVLRNFVFFIKCK